jgi:hypothetical protein
MIEGYIPFGIRPGWWVPAEEESLDLAGKVIQADHNTQAGHLQPDFQPVAFGVLGAQPEAIPLDQVQDALEAGAIPDSGQFAA